MLGTFPKVFSKGDFPIDNFTSGIFPNVQFLKQQLSAGCNGGPRLCGLKMLGGLALRIGQTWEVANSENTFKKFLLGKIPLGKYLT